MKKCSFFLSLIFFISFLRVQNFSDWTPTPPMGWNSWDCYGPTVTENEVKVNADYMAKYLKEYGWEYIVVDIRWYVQNDKLYHANLLKRQTLILRTIKPLSRIFSSTMILFFFLARTGTIPWVCTTADAPALYMR